MFSTRTMVRYFVVAGNIYIICIDFFFKGNKINFVNASNSENYHIMSWFVPGIIQCI